MSLFFVMIKNYYLSQTTGSEGVSFLFPQLFFSQQRLKVLAQWGKAQTRWCSVIFKCWMWVTDWDSRCKATTSTRPRLHRLRGRLIGQRPPTGGRFDQSEGEFEVLTCRWLHEWGGLSASLGSWCGCSLHTPPPAWWRSRWAWRRGPAPVGLLKYLHWNTELGQRNEVWLTIGVKQLEFVFNSIICRLSLRILNKQNRN